MPNAPDPRHSLPEDIYAFLIGSSLCAFGVMLLKMAGLVTGGVAGLALIGSYVSGLPVGALFFLINLPFLVLAQRTLGWRFAIKSAITVALLSIFTVLIPHWLQGVTVDPWFAALFGGTIIGVGILSLARHKTSVGGVGVVAIYLYEKHGINAGKVQGVADTLIIALAFVAVDLRHLALSVLSAAALSLVLFAYHKPGRYTGY
jgi:uncharacterized membrane-anchored protein YitT (DUF2179 family)